MKVIVGLILFFVVIEVPFVYAFRRTPASRPYVIGDVPGGRMDEFATAFSLLRASERRVMVDGYCESACTMVLGFIPPERICVTRKARFGFHRAFESVPFEARGIKVDAPEANAAMWSLYPSSVQAWLTARGGLTNDMKTMSYPETLKAARAC